MVRFCRSNTQLQNRIEIVAIGGFDKRVTMLRVEYGTKMMSCGTGDPCFVRSVHMVEKSSRLAIGVDEGSKGGSVRLYETEVSGGGEDAELLHRWFHDQPVWCVRLTSEKLNLLHVAGYDGCVTTYDCVSKARLMSICFSQVRKITPQ